MATSTTRNFNLQIDEIIRLASKRAYGSDQIAGVEAADARLLLNLVLTDLVNRGAPLSTFKKYSETTVAETSSFDLTGGIIDIYDVVSRRDSIDMSMTRISLFDYHKIANKTVSGRPTQYAVDRQNDALTVYMYPVPDRDSDEIIFYGITRNYDVTASYQEVDLSYRFTPALVSGLAYYLCLNRPEVSEKGNNRATLLKMQYEEELMNAFGEDRERGTIKFSMRLR